MEGIDGRWETDLRVRSRLLDGTLFLLSGTDTFEITKCCSKQLWMKLIMGTTIGEVIASPCEICGRSYSPVPLKAEVDFLASSGLIVRATAGE